MAVAYCDVKNCTEYHSLLGMTNLNIHFHTSVLFVQLSVCLLSMYLIYVRD